MRLRGNNISVLSFKGVLDVNFNKNPGPFFKDTRIVDKKSESFFKEKSESFFKEKSESFFKETRIEVRSSKRLGLKLIKLFLTSPLCHQLFNRRGELGQIYAFYRRFVFFQVRKTAQNG